MNIILFGKPGCGKGTQAALLTHNGFTHISSGQLLRKESEQGTELGKQIKAYLEQGELVPDKLVLQIVKNNLGEENLFDGFPRDLTQAESLDEIAPIHLVINLHIPDEESIKRLLKRKRTDDTEQTIKHRLEIYHDITDPLLEYYKPRDITKTIDGLQDVQTIHDTIMQTITEARTADQ